MNVAVFSIYDSKIGTFAQPFFMINKGAALRAWHATANDLSTNIGKYPADFTLFEIGTFDDTTGIIEMLDVKINLGTALEMLAQENKRPQMAPNNDLDMEHALNNKGVQQ